MGLTHWWKTGAAPNDYEFGLAEEPFQAQPVAYLRSIVHPARSFGAFCQTIAAEDYRGTWVRFSATLKANNLTNGWGGLRVDGARLDETLAIDTMEDRPLVDTTGWQEHALVLDVAAAAAMISFGAGLSGEGELLVSQLAFEEVGDEVPVTAGPHRPRHPLNLDFSQA
jgi:AraC family transcriptional regulator